MVILHLSLALGALSCLWVGWASWSAGFPPETALVRGLAAFMAVTLLGYIGELIVATAPRRRQRAPHATAEPAAAIEAAAHARAAENAGGIADAPHGDNVTLLPARTPRGRRAA